MLFYRIANNEVHPTFGKHEISTDLKLLLPSIPLLPMGITHDAGELSVEYQTARLLQNTTRRASDYIALPVELQGSLTTLNDLPRQSRKIHAGRSTIEAQRSPLLHSRSSSTVLRTLHDRP